MNRILSKKMLILALILTGNIMLAEASGPTDIQFADKGGGGDGSGSGCTTSISKTTGILICDNCAAEIGLGMPHAPGCICATSGSSGSTSGGSTSGGSNNSGLLFNFGTNPPGALGEIGSTSGGGTSGGGTSTYGNNTPQPVQLTTEDQNVLNNLLKPKPDCAGVMGGTAYTDNCKQCVGGTTGKLPCNLAVIAPQASKKFKGSLTTEQWTALEKIVTIMSTDCAGGTLLNAIPDGNVTIVFNASEPTAKTSADGKTITLNNFDYDATNNVFTKGANTSLFHEMFHVYQIQKARMTNANMANREVECKIAQVMYSIRADVDNLAQLNYDTGWFDKNGFANDAARLSSLLNENGNIPSQNLLLFNAGFQGLANNIYLDSAFDVNTYYNTTSDTNITSLQEIAAGCK